jgi:hypothetical protein
MGFFSKRPSTVVPAGVLAALPAYGEASWQARVAGRSVADPRFAWDGFFSPASQALRADPARTIEELYVAADDRNTVLGAYSLLTEIDAPLTDPHYLELMDATLQMMFEAGLSSGHLNRYEADRWIATHGDLRTSFDRIVDVAPPPPDLAADVSLGPGESLMVATMGPNALDNQFWIERTAAGTYAAFSMREWEAGDGVLTRCAEDQIGTHETAMALLQRMGSYLGVQTYWAHDLLMPYFTQRRQG